MHVWNTACQTHLADCATTCFRLVRSSDDRFLGPHLAQMSQLWSEVCEGSLSWPSWCQGRGKWCFSKAAPEAGPSEGSFGQGRPELKVFQLGRVRWRSIGPGLGLKSWGVQCSNWSPYILLSRNVLGSAVVPFSFITKWY